MGLAPPHFPFTRLRACLPASMPARGDISTHNLPVHKKTNTYTYIWGLRLRTRRRGVGAAPHSLSHIPHARNRALPVCLPACSLAWKPHVLGMKTPRSRAISGGGLLPRRPRRPKQENGCLGGGPVEGECPPPKVPDGNCVR